ncbi:hydroxymethylbilane synthase [Lichenihabitans psoromatis]|uniref:hydroxymethylbilane synthase n=1 Tax=Lichenihabitans psoromatis TaxID=2528642 RepID=UPI0010383660|nr:hydroxymethylbilane synthase [Lichenihabitans psoromatis]
MKLGTRGSPLALAQAHEARRRLASANGWADDAIEIVVIRTTGDLIQDRALSEAGGKGLFTKELDRALIDCSIDLAVHSAKDLPTTLPAAIAIAGYLPREDVRDVLIAPRAKTIAGLPRGATVGTASLRRQAQVMRLRPDVEVKLLRGNVGSRLRKVESGEFDATLLALAGLNRLGLAEHATAILDTDDFLPAVGQGAIAVTIRTHDEMVRSQVSGVIDHATTVALACERAFLTVLDGSCRTPIAGFASLTDATLSFRGIVLSSDGSEAIESIASAGPDYAAELGEDAARSLLARCPPHILAPFKPAG